MLLQRDHGNYVLSYSLDFLDGLVCKIRVDCRGLEIMRVLPIV
jgi:hypothetical protein